MGPYWEQTFEHVEQLLYRCETDDNLDRAESILLQVAQETRDPEILARVYAELAQVEFWRYEYAPQDRRLTVAAKGVKLAKRALEYDSNHLQANAWAAAMMGLHGLEMGILSSLFYIGQVRDCAERALQVDEAYHSALPHQILGDLFRLTPPSPVGFRDKQKALAHLQRARALAPACPQAKLRLAELYVNLRKDDLARRELQAVLGQEIEERGPLFAAKYKQKAADMAKKLG